MSLWPIVIIVKLVVSVTIKLMGPPLWFIMSVIAQSIRALRLGKIRVKSSLPLKLKTGRVIH
jgi:hypothetical protein